MFKNKQKEASFNQYLKDKPLADLNEKKVLAYFESKGGSNHLTVSSGGLSTDNRKDLVVKLSSGKIITIECKQDFTCKRTGNVGLEFSCRGKDSGIAVTKAMFYAYTLHEPNGKINLYLIPTTTLKKMIEEESFSRIVNGGDPGSDSLNYLFSLELFKSKATYLTTFI